MASPPKKNGKYVLLIEDEAIMATILERRLRGAGYRVRVEHDGVRGLEAIRSDPPDAVLLDMMMPRLDGYGVLEALAKERIIPDLPVFIISNSGQPVETEQALKLGARGYLVKVTIEPDEVVELLERLFAAEINPPRRDARADSATAGRGTVLIVEDDQLLADLLRRKLESRGYGVERAATARQADRLIENHPVDLMLLDLVLPVMDGLAYLRELKSDPKRKSIPVIIVSNLGQREEIQRGLAAGAVAYLVKANVTPNDIVDAVDRYLHPEERPAARAKGRGRARKG